MDEILAAGWPGERPVGESGPNRVYVALATLRRLGLREFLLTHEGGYLLDPAVPLLLAADAQDA